MPMPQQPDAPLSASALATFERKVAPLPTPTYHPQWKLMRVIGGHNGWVRSISVNPSNEWFATGSADSTVKIWDLASGTLRLTLTGHISTVRALCISERHPYLFSGGEDNMVKCWDLEQNKIVRHYHGHLAGIYGLSMHPSIDIFTTCSRDGSAKVWDIRTKQCIHTLSGHKGAVNDVKMQDANPQVVTASQDCTVRLWDLVAGQTLQTLTHHKKSVRSLLIHPVEYSFASGAVDNIKKWKFPHGEFMHNFAGHDSIVNTLSINADNVMVSGGDDGTLVFWDWSSGQPFQRIQSIAQPGSLESEAGVYCSTFDRTGLRLLTGEADKSIKVWRELRPEETE